MDERIAGLLDKQAITEMLHRVARGIDRGDVELVAACFHEDGTDYHGLANGPVGKVLSILGQGRLHCSQHAISNILIDLDGDSAKVESCFNAAHQARAADGQYWDELLRGRYLDRVERRGDGEWKIARRVVLWDWSRVEPSGESWFDRMRARPGMDDRYIFGRRDQHDMVYTDRLPDEFLHEAEQ